MWEKTRVLIQNKGKNKLGTPLGTRKQDMKFKPMRHVLINVRNELAEHNALITEADNDNSMAVLYKDEYLGKVADFINTNDIRGFK